MGRLDVVFASAPIGTRKGVWCGVEPWSGPRPIRFDPVQGAALPWPVSRAIVAREAALAALTDNELIGR